MPFDAADKRCRRAGAPARQVCRHAGGWLVKFIDRLAALPIGQVTNETVQTALGELALLAIVMGRSARWQAHPVSVRILDLLGQVYRDPGFHEFPFARETRAVTAHLLIRTALRGRQRGRVPTLARYERLIESSDFTARTDRGVRQIELRYVLSSAGLPCRLPPYRSLFRRTPLSLPLASPLLTEPDIYGITHTIPYLTDFGARVFVPFSGAVGRRMEATVRGLLDATVLATHLDLISELLLCHACLGCRERLSWRAAWRSLREHQDGSGRVAIAPVAGRPPSARQAEPGQWADLLLTYHTTLMAFMAGVVGDSAATMTTASR